VAILVGRPRRGDLTEDGEGAVEAEASLEVEVEIKDEVSRVESIGAVWFRKGAFWKSARPSTTTSWPSVLTVSLTPDELMMSERRVPASLLILRAQP
jgi:hypothetical protein